MQFLTYAGYSAAVVVTLQFVFAGIAAVYVAMDAYRRGLSSPVLWGAGIFATGILGLLAYLAERRMGRHVTRGFCGPPVPEPKEPDAPPQETEPLA